MQRRRHSPQKLRASASNAGTSGRTPIGALRSHHRLLHHSLAQLSTVSLRTQGNHCVPWNRSPAVRAISRHAPRTDIPRLLCRPDRTGKEHSLSDPGLATTRAARAELVLAGRVLPEMDWLCERRPSSRIRLAGILNRKELASFYGQADVFVFPSVNEGLAMALLEAMSAGVPANACRGAGAEDLLTPGQPRPVGARKRGGRAGRRPVVVLREPAAIAGDGRGRQRQNRRGVYAGSLCPEAACVVSIGRGHAQFKRLIFERQARHAYVPTMSDRTIPGYLLCQTSPLIADTWMRW